MPVDYRDAPDLYDHPRLGGEPMPGSRVICTGGGEWEVEIDQQMSPQYAGAYTNVKTQKMQTVSYRIEAVSRRDRENLHAWLDWAKSVRAAKPPVVLELVDPDLEHNGLTRTIFQKIGRVERDLKTGVHSVEITLVGYKKKIKFGGNVKPREKTDAEKQLEALNEQDKKLDKVINDLYKGLKKPGGA